MRVRGERGVGGRGGGEGQGERGVVGGKEVHGVKPGQLLH